MLWIVVSGFGVAVLVAWWLAWSGRWAFWSHRPKLVRLLLHPGPGVALTVFAVGLGVTADELSGGAHDALTLVATLVLLAGFAAVVLGVVCALYAVVRPLPRGLDADWLREGTNNRADSVRCFVIRSGGSCSSSPKLR